VSLPLLTFQIKLDKLEHVLTGSIVRFKGLVNALGFNNHLCECLEFDFELKRYQVVTAKGDLKKVKPENLEYVTRYSSTPPSKKNILEAAQLRNQPSKIRDLFNRLHLPIPLAVPGKVFEDCMRLESPEFRRTLVESKPVSIENLEDFKTRIFFISLPRKSCTPDFSEIPFSDICEFYRSSFNKNPREQIYFILPQTLAQEAFLPAQRKAVALAYPLAVAVAGGLAVLGGLDAWQSTDVAISQLSGGLPGAGPVLEDYAYLMEGK